jgi:hypothetical protein
MPHEKKKEVAHLCLPEGTDAAIEEGEEEELEQN